MVHSSRLEPILPVPQAPKTHRSALVQPQTVLSPMCSPAQGSALQYRSHVFLTSQEPAPSPIASRPSHILRSHPARSRTGVRQDICPCAPCASLSQAAHPAYSPQLNLVTTFAKLAFSPMWLSPLKNISIRSSIKTPLSPPGLHPQPHTSVAPPPHRICSLLPSICAYLLLCLYHISQIQAERS